MTETETPTPTDTLTEKQAAFLTDLLDKRTGYTPEFGERVREAIAGARPMTKQQATDTISWLLGAPKVAKAPAAKSADVPLADVGLYRADDGQVWKVYLTQNKRTAGKVLVVTETADGWAGRFEFVRGGQYAVSKALAAGTTHAMTQAEAEAFGRQYEICCNCSADLNEDRSIASGFGPTCAGNRGWHYLTKAEAAEVLGRPVV